MTIHEATKAMIDQKPVWYLDNDGEAFEAQVESIDDEGYVIINIANENRLRVSPEELNAE